MKTPPAGACTSPDSSGAGVHALIPTKASAAAKRALSSRTDREHVRRELDRLRNAIATEIEKSEERLDAVLRRDDLFKSFRLDPVADVPATLWSVAAPIYDARNVGLLFDFLIEAAS